MKFWQKIKDVIDWLRRIQFLYVMAALLISGSAATSVRAYIYKTSIPLVWRLPLYLFTGAVTMFVCGFVTRWWSKRNKPPTVESVNESQAAPSPTAATRSSELKHNVKFVGIRRATPAQGVVLIVACFQNKPIPHSPLATFSEGRVRIDLFSGSGKEFSELFPATWMNCDEPIIDLEAGKTNCVTVSAYIKGQWYACQTNTVETSYEIPAYEVEKQLLPTGEKLTAVVTLLGERNVSLDPIRLTLTLSPDGKAEWEEF